MTRLLKLIEGKVIKLHPLEAMRSRNIFLPYPADYVVDGLGVLTLEAQTFHSPKTKCVEIFPYETLRNTDRYEIAAEIRNAGSDIVENTMQLQHVSCLMEKQRNEKLDFFLTETPDSGSLPTIFFMLTMSKHPIFEGRVYHDAQGKWGVTTEVVNKPRWDIPQGSQICLLQGFGKTF